MYKKNYIGAKGTDCKMHWTITARALACNANYNSKIDNKLMIINDCTAADDFIFSVAPPPPSPLWLSSRVTFSTLSSLFIWGFLEYLTLFRIYSFQLMRFESSSASRYLNSIKRSNMRNVNPWSYFKSSDPFPLLGSTVIFQLRFNIKRLIISHFVLIACVCLHVRGQVCVFCVRVRVQDYNLQFW